MIIRIVVFVGEYQVIQFIMVMISAIDLTTTIVARVITISLFIKEFIAEIFTIIKVVIVKAIITMDSKYFK